MKICDVCGKSSKQENVQSCLIGPCTQYNTSGDGWDHRVTRDLCEVCSNRIRGRVLNFLQGASQGEEEAKGPEAC